jgi:hypothetical protein
MDSKPRDDRWIVLDCVKDNGSNFSKVSIGNRLAVLVTIRGVILLLFSFALVIRLALALLGLLFCCVLLLCA